MVAAHDFTRDKQKNEEHVEQSNMSHIFFLLFEFLMFFNFTFF